MIPGHGGIISSVEAVTTGELWSSPHTDPVSDSLGYVMRCNREEGKVNKQTAVRASTCSFATPLGTQGAGCGFKLSINFSTQPVS